MARRRISGTGSVFRRKSDGLWIAQVSIGNRDRRRYIVRSGRTRDQAVAKLEALRGALESGIVPSRLTTGDYLERWVSDARNIRDTTRAGYRAVVTHHLVPTIGHVPVTDLTPVHVERMLSDLGPTMSPKSLRNVHVVLRRALGQAYRTGLVQRNVAGREFVDAPTWTPPDPDALTEAQLEAILSAATDDRLAPLLIVAADTGLRQGELLGLAWEDIDDGWLQVRKELARIGGRYSREEPKTRWSKRRVPMTPRAIDAIASQRSKVIGEGFAPTATGPVFVNSSGGPLNGSWITHRWYDFCEAAGLNPRPFKILRATYGSRLYDAGVPEPTIRQLMGHAPGSRVTFQHYVSRTGDQAMAAVARLVSHAVVTEPGQDGRDPTRRAVS